MNNAQANGIMLLVDWLRGDDRRGHLVVNEQRIADALSALVAGAARQLQTSRRPHEVEAAAARLWHLASADRAQQADISDPRTAVFQWDYREQPDVEAIADAVRDLSGGRLHLALVDTDGQDYAAVLSTLRLDGDAARVVWAEATGHDA